MNKHGDTIGFIARKLFQLEYSINKLRRQLEAINDVTSFTIFQDELSDLRMRITNAEANINLSDAFSAAAIAELRSDVGAILEHLEIQQKVEQEKQKDGEF